MTTCPRCGRPTAPHRGCPCGAAGPPHPIPFAPSTSVAPHGLLPAAAFALAALLALFWAFSDLGYGIGGIVLLLTLLPALVVPMVLALIAAGLARGKRVARSAAAFVTPVLGVMAVNSSSAGFLVVDFLLVAASVAALVLVPGLRAHFAADRPALAPSVALVRMVVAVLASISAAVVALSLVLVLVSLVGVSSASQAAEDSGVPGVEGQFLSGFLGIAATMVVTLAVVLVVIHGGLCAFGFWVRTAMARHHVVARVLLTVVLALATVVLVVVGVSSTVGGPTAVVATVHVALLVLLWVPSDARVHFGDRPIAAVEDLRRSLAAGTPARSRPTDGPFGPPTSSWSPPLGGAWPVPSSPPTARPSPPAARPSPPARSAGPVGPIWSAAGSPRTARSFAIDGPTTGVRAVPPTPAPTPVITPAAPAIDAATVAVPGRACTACDQPVERAWSHCAHCGSRLGAVESEPRP